MERTEITLRESQLNMDRQTAVIEHIKAGRYEEAKQLLGQWLAEDDSCPEIHNLLGVLYEQQANHRKALAHYRAAYALDPSYEYARLNLERVTESFVERHNLSPYYGNEDLTVSKHKR